MLIELTEIVDTNEAAGNTLCTPLVINSEAIRHFYESVGRTYLVLLPDMACVAVTESYAQIKAVLAVHSLRRSYVIPPRNPQKG